MTVVLSVKNKKVAVRMKAVSAAVATGEKGGRGRKASKETRRQQLIEATIDSLAKRGYAETTLADVADGAGLSRGIVNFHFESKENLLIATLSTWVCGYVRLKDGESSAAQQYDSPNAVSDPAISGYLVNDWGYGHANGKGIAAVDPKILAEKGYADVDEFVDKMLFRSPVPTICTRR